MSNSNSTFDINLDFDRAVKVKVITKARNMIQKQTYSGKDINNRTFRSLKNSYNGSHKSNLHRSGNMLNNIESKMNTNSVELYSGIAYGNYHNTGTGKLPVREWIGLCNKDADIITELIVDELMKEK